MEKKVIAKKRLFVTVSGKVQDVFFRKFVMDNACILGLKGWVRNNYDNRTVEALFEGDQDRICDMVDLLWKGPKGANVENVEMRYEEYAGDYDFFNIVG
ncbi:MAG: acylphosphatase [Candidatus Heimdallarchaeota archaeon]|nr:acylphosphatase [Candidatus Heimdallarchaeota archaeon]